MIHSQDIPKEELVTVSMGYPYRLTIRYFPKSPYRFQFQLNDEVAPDYIIPSQEIAFGEVTLSGAARVEYAGFPLTGK